MPSPPCKHCERKGCGEYHSRCPKYLEFRRKMEEVYKNRKKELDINEYRRNCI